jgi:4-hydroxybenzoyl-CoA thioesterase
MSRTHLHRLTVEFGDCDPAQIAYFPNFFRWFDAASRHFFAQCGLPPWRETEQTHGIIGTPVVETACRFLLPTTYGDELEVHTAIEEWRDKSFAMKHQLRRGEAVLAECREVRVFAIRHPEDPRRIKVVPVPPAFRALCE